MDDVWSILGQYFSHFGVMLRLWTPSWGPLASLRAILGCTSKVVAIFDKNGEKTKVVHFGTHFGTTLCMLKYFGAMFVGSVFNFGKYLGGANVDEVQ